MSSYTGKDGYGLQFCKHCGSTLCGVFDGQIHGVTLGCVDGDPNIGEVKHIYVGSKANWEVIPDTVPQCIEGDQSNN